MGAQFNVEHAHALLARTPAAVPVLLYLIALLPQRATPQTYKDVSFKGGLLPPPVPAGLRTSVEMFKDDEAEHCRRQDRSTPTVPQPPSPPPHLNFDIVLTRSLEMRWAVTQEYSGDFDHKECMCVGAQFNVEHAQPS